MNRLEYKDLALPAVGLKTAEASDGIFRVTGYGSTFGGPADSYGDIIAPGAFAKSLQARAAAGKGFPMLFNHDPDKTIGKWPRMFEDEKGLRAENGELSPGNRQAEDVAALLKHGAVDGLSIGFVTKAWERPKSGIEADRILTEIDLWELSVVTIPANSFARVTEARSIRTERDFEAALRSLGYSRREAEIICRSGFKALSGSRDESDRLSAQHGSRDENGGGLEALLAALQSYGPMSDSNLNPWNRP